MKSKQQMIFEEMCYQLMKVITAPEHEYIDDKGVDDSQEVNETNVKLVMSSHSRQHLSSVRWCMAYRLRMS